MAQSTPENPTNEDAVSSRGARKWWWAGGAVVLAALVALVVLAGGQSTSQPGASADGTGGPAASAASDSGTVAPIRLASIDGKPVSLPARGHPGALFFSVSSCLSCIPSAQALATVKHKFGKQLDAVFISLDPQDPVDQLRARRDSIGNPPYPFAVDTTGSLAQRYQVQALGTTIIYDAQGRLADRLVEPSLSDLEAGFRKAGLT